VDPRKVKPRRDWVLVLLDQRKTQLASGLFIPGSETGVEKVTESAGEVIRLGPSDKLIGKLEVKEGDRIVFRAFLKHHMSFESEETWPDGGKKEFFLMDVADIMAVIGEGISVGVFSSPSQKAVESVDAEGNVRMR
jgi:co-chaperonin GroES (HSP10)